MYTLVTYTLRVLAVNVNVQLLTTFVPATHSMDSLRLCLQLITPIVHYPHRAITVSDAATPQQTMRVRLLEKMGPAQLWDASMIMHCMFHIMIGLRPLRLFKGLRLPDNS